MALRSILPLTVAGLLASACSGGSGASVAGEPTGSASGTAPELGWRGDVDARSCADDQRSAPLLRCTADAGARPLALGICGDLAADNTLTLESRPGADGAALAVNGRSRIAAPLRVGGAFTSVLGIEANNTLDIDGALRTNGNWTVSSPARVGGDAFVGGALDAKNTVDVAGALHVAELASSTNVRAGSIVSGATTVAAALDCGRAPDVQALARGEAGPFHEHRADALAAVKERTTVRLGCSRYRFSAIGVDNELTVRIDGRVVIVVDGDMRIGGPTRFELAAGAELDLVVSGAHRVDNTLSITGARAWVGVGGDVRIASPTTLDGWLVAPRANLAADNTLTLNGAAYVGALRVASPLVVRAGGSLDAAGCVLP